MAKMFDLYNLTFPYLPYLIRQAKNKFNDVSPGLIVTTMFHKCEENQFEEQQKYYKYMKYFFRDAGWWRM